jgi:hypothetical protein
MFSGNTPILLPFLIVSSARIRYQQSFIRSMTK